MKIILTELPKIQSLHTIRELHMKKKYLFGPIFGSNFQADSLILTLKIFTI